MNAKRALVIGSHGLLGQALSRELTRRGADVFSPEIRWGLPASRSDLQHAFRSLTKPDEPWSLYWSAGAGVTQTPQNAFDEEIAVFSSFVDHIARSKAASRGTIFFASSVGGAYGGSANPPFTESTLPSPLAPYGQTKLILERIVASLTDVGARVAIGRIANLYGPGQNLAKPQGLVSQLCVSLVTNRPLGVYVPMDTLRDYIYVQDAATVVVDLLQTVAAWESGSRPVTKIIATGQAISIAKVLGEMRLIARRRPPLILASSTYATSQTRDLRVRSTVFPELDRRAHTPFPVGFARTLADVRSRILNPS
ncbi:NAD-dependent epimerase/dehydratase family protein [Humibacter sp. RRB41]|uniref:NAD-dependent epimerase/dehydratase family protein n=1 Tax=Humibacter sp. RRB41 TaxID=2919946 RepID=UPI001FAB06D1|nr:NAD-dependent epimerase/dehydratase family protein [Humibacter sp. RRB41]